ncbi:MAG: gamma-glutamyl-gamma-aminobutyrate hydrolase family protein [Clostridiaceae bacterium]
MKKIIGIAGTVKEAENSKVPGIEQAYVNDDYIRAAENAGGVPLILPVVNDEENIKLQVKTCDAIILSGGQDINPLFYGEEPHKNLGFTNLRVDEYQIKLVKFALEQRKRILGICRGNQVLNVACGGTLYQDLSEVNENTLKHFQESSRYYYSHRIKVEAGTILSKLLGGEALVNSFHHQCIKELGKGLKAAAFASDGIIEAAEMIDRDFVMGVQWHPEMMSANSETMMILFKELINF